MIETLVALAVGIPVSLLLANGIEWFFHKHVLHGPGKRQGNFWNFHWYQHHHESRKHGMPDVAYQEGSLFEWNSRTKELAALAIPVALLIPVLLFGRGVGQVVAAGLIYSAVNYCHVHRRAHRDPVWARKHLPWHVDHHLGPNQDTNWCITKPWFDLIMGTRERYVGTAREAADLAGR